MSVPTVRDTGATARPAFHTDAATRGDACVSCAKAPGRRRPALTQGGPELVVCDACWLQAGGAAVMAEQQALLDTDNGPRHWDEVLTSAGVRWVVLRHVPRPARRDLALVVLSRVPPAGTKRAESRVLWLDEVRRRAETTSAFKQARSRRKAVRVAEAYAQCVDHDGRPLTWVTQDEIAAAVGCSDRTVRRYLEWLRAEGLLFELVPGTRLPSMDRPEGETEAEAAERRQREAAAEAAEAQARERARAALAAHRDAERQRARAELDAVRAGQRGTAAAEAAAEAAEALSLPDLQAVLDEARAAISAANEATLINVAPVYELRLPLDPDERAESDGLREAMTRENVVAAGAGTENVHPPSLSQVDLESSDCARPVDKSRRFAPQGHEGGSSIKNGPDLASEGRSRASQADHPDSRKSRALRAAEALLGGWLDRKLRRGVTKTWLAARIAHSGLLDHGWELQDLADQIAGRPEWPHLPAQIHNPRAFIHARLAAASPVLPPSKLELVREVENAEAQQRRRAREAAAAREAAEAIRVCPLCDEVGWLEVDDPAVDAIRCSHDPDTGGW